MNEYSDEDLLARWEEFFESSGLRFKLIEVADHFPEERSVYVPYLDLDLFDPDFADYLMQHPLKVLNLGKQAA